MHCDPAAGSPVSSLFVVYSLVRLTVYNIVRTPPCVIAVSAANPNTLHRLIVVRSEIELRSIRFALARSHQDLPYETLRNKIRMQP